MRNLTIVVAFAAAGLVGALAGEMISADREEQISPSPIPTDLPDRVARLEGRLSEALEEIETLKAAGALPAPMVTAASEAPSGPAGSLESAAADIAESRSATFDDRVREVVEAREAEERAERSRRLAESLVGAEERMVQRLATELELDQTQEADLTGILGRRRKAMNELRQQMVAGGGVEGGNREDRELIREEMRTIRQAADAEVQGILTEDQYKAFKKVDGRRTGTNRTGRRPR